MADKIAAEGLYLQSALAEAFRVIERDHGAAYVDQFVEAVFRTYNVQAGFLEAHDSMPPSSIDQDGRAVVMRVLTRARNTPDPLF